MPLSRDSQADSKAVDAGGKTRWQGPKKWASRGGEGGWKWKGFALQLPLRLGRSFPPFLLLIVHPLHALSIGKRHWNCLDNAQSMISSLLDALEPHD